MLRYFIFIEYGLLPDLRVGVLISASQSVFPRTYISFTDPYGAAKKPFI